MAGAEFKKYGNSAFGEMACHFDNDIRAKIEHSNKTINKELTHLNYYLGANNYQEIVGRTERIIAETDEKNPPKRVRKDRKVTFSLEIPCPPELEGTAEEDVFYEKVYEMYRSYLPGIAGAVIHKDEKHEYYDSKKKEFCISRNHMCILGACLTNDGRINAHDLITKELCKKVNDDIQELCLREWGLSYQTGEGRTGAKKTVEELKQESQVTLQEKMAKENLTVLLQIREDHKQLTGEIKELKIIKEMDESIVRDLDKQVEEKTDLVREKQAHLDDLQAKVENTTTELANLEKEASRKLRLIDKLNDTLANLFTRFNKAYIQIQKIFDHWYNHDLKIYRKLVEKTTPSIEKGKKAIDIMIAHNQNIVFGQAKVTQQVEKEVDVAKEELKEATEELEEIEEEYDFER